MSLNINNTNIEIREDGFINATQLCKAGGKKFGHWISLYSTKELMNELEHIEKGKKVIDVKKGRYNSGSWIHSKLAIHLAMWINPVFGLKVSEWVEEWKSLSLMNEHIFYKELNEIQPSYKTQREKEIQEDLKHKLHAKSEVETPAGFIDLETEDKIIEIKEIRNWKHAIGQILSYGIYINKEKWIYLFGEGEQSTIMEVCDKLGINLVFL